MPEGRAHAPLPQARVQQLRRPAAEEDGGHAEPDRPGPQGDHERRDAQPDMQQPVQQPERRARQHPEDDGPVAQVEPVAVVGRQQHEDQRAGGHDPLDREVDAAEQDHEGQPDAHDQQDGDLGEQRAEVAQRQEGRAGHGEHQDQRHQGDERSGVAGQTSDPPGAPGGWRARDLAGGLRHRMSLVVDRHVGAAVAGRWRPAGRPQLVMGPWLRPRGRRSRPAGRSAPAWR